MKENQSSITALISAFGRAYHFEKSLENAGWLIYEQLSHADIEQRYFMGRDDYLHAFEHINYALAVVK